MCEQTFKPEVDELMHTGHPVILPGEDPPVPGGYALVLVLPPRQRDEARTLLARAVMAAAPGGRVLACASNNEGARSVQADLERLAGPVEVMVKNKCRVFWSGPLQGAADPMLAQAWVRLDAPRRIAGGRYVSRPGLFAWDRIDPASALLGSLLPLDLAGHAADLGAGHGYLSVQLLERCPGIEALDVIDAERRALDLARVNLAPFQARIAIDFLWHDVMAGLARRYDVIVTNPPFHAQRGADRPDIGRRFLAAAAQALAGGGRLWLVANRHLPYEAELARGFAAVHTIAQAGGFKVIEAVKARRQASRAAVSR
ncbi:class I SAM-dependent methyltransferase [Steroidobacter denitrificans]|uniref:class I SAM-dependent methyltransferase n=1 Tax=Steroidobacter denitrificans TaxID=465721 RepID=UPI001AEF57C9|nr:methyltransferase [Steroidobacter denitrificans]